jgi:hypothetical protein
LGQWLIFIKLVNPFALYFKFNAIALHDFRVKAFARLYECPRDYELFKMSDSHAI